MFGYGNECQVVENYYSAWKLVEIFNTCKRIIKKQRNRKNHSYYRLSYQHKNSK